MKQTDHQCDSNDAELVLRAQGGDPAAANELVTRYQDRVYNTCYRMCHNHADALDLTQSTFLKAFEALPRFEVRAKFFTWLYRIAVNVTLSHRRSRGRHPVLSLRQLEDDRERPFDPPAENDDSDPARQVSRNELHRQLEAALDRLDDEFRVAVVLRDIEGLDYQAIAEILGVPTGTVKSRISRGRRTLRQLLEQEEPQLGVG